MLKKQLQDLGVLEIKEEPETIKDELIEYTDYEHIFEDVEAADNLFNPEQMKLEGELCSLQFNSYTTPHSEDRTTLTLEEIMEKEIDFTINLEKPRNYEMNLETPIGHLCSMCGKVFVTSYGLVYFKRDVFKI